MGLRCGERNFGFFGLGELVRGSTAVEHLGELVLVIWRL